MNRRLWVPLLAIGLLGGAPIGLWADAAEPGISAASTAARPAKTRAFPFRGRIAAVDRESGTITLKGKEKARQFRITSGTRIIKDGQPATLADAKVGAEVGGQAQTTEEGQFEALSLRIGPKPDPGAAGKTPKEPAAATDASMK
jgi:hypothetical protein